MVRPHGLGNRATQRIQPKMAYVRNLYFHFKIDVKFAARSAMLDEALTLRTPNYRIRVVLLPVDENL